MLYRGELLLSLTPQEWGQIFSTTFPTTHTHTHRPGASIGITEERGTPGPLSQVCSGQAPSQPQAFWPSRGRS